MRITVEIEDGGVRVRRVLVREFEERLPELAERVRRYIEDSTRR